MIYVRVPASSANLGPGFDTLGMALRLYLNVSVKSTKSASKLVVRGEGANTLSQGEQNLLWQVMRRVAEEHGRALPNLSMRVNNQIPMARGLGSSAAAIIAGILITDKVCNLNLSEDQILSHALKMEGHPDNVTASLVGGFVTSCNRDGHILYVKNRIRKRIKALLVVPDFELSTAKARAVLPETFSRKDAVFNLQRTAVFVAALKAGKDDVIAEAIRDVLHQPYRTALIPGLEKTLALRDISGLLGVALSGAGPTILALTTENFEEIGERIKINFREHGIASEALLLEIDNKGSRVRKSL